MGAKEPQVEVIDYIDLTVIDPEHVTKAVLEYIDSRKDIINTLDVQIRVSICKEQPTVRAGRNERAQALAQLVAMTGVKTWEEGQYKFDFSTNSYVEIVRNQPRPIHITAGEAVALYQRLVRKQSNDDWPSFYANMKKRNGSEFLKEFV
jgi:hypothetical protein